MIVNGSEQYNTLIERMNRESYVLTPIFRDAHYHVMENVVLCVGITFANRETFVVSISHEDAPMFPFPPTTILCHTTDSKLLPSPTVDLGALAYANGQTLPELEAAYTPYTQDTLNLFSSLRDVNRVIPITTWATILHTYNGALCDLRNRGFEFHPGTVFTQILIDTLQRIEQSGLAVDREKLAEHFGSKTLRSFKSNMVYSQYNVFTATGRPSNRFGGINFSALNKTDGTRECFISRYPEGKLVQLDFEAYHLRLVADDLGVTLPTWPSLHRGLGQMYFDTDDITPEMYAESKRRTFEIMYGMTDETYGFELFEKIHEARKQHANTNIIVLPSGVVAKVQDASASKLFNYYVQSLEVVTTTPKLQRVLELIEGTDTKLILYTYDSILLDTPDVSGNLLPSIVEMLEEEGKFPVRVYSGTTYANLEEMTRF